MVQQYFASDTFRHFDPQTKSGKRSSLGRYCKREGLPVYAELCREDVEASRDDLAATPGAADNLTKHLRALFNWAISKRLMRTNPAAGVAKHNRSDGYHCWTREEVERYRQYHLVGSKARLALELMINTGVRKSDAARIGRHNEINYQSERGIEIGLKFVCWKNRNSKFRKTIECPMTRNLREVLAATSLGERAYLVTAHGRPFTINGLGNKMREWCDQAGLFQCSSHGLRKASAVILAESGATGPELCAIFGWSKLQTAEIYIQQAQKRRLVWNAFNRLEDFSSAPPIGLSSI